MKTPRDWRTELWNVHKRVVNFPVGSSEDVRFLAMGLAGEVGEVLNIIKKDWRGDSGDRRAALREELGDAQAYLSLLVRTCGFDPDEMMYRVVKKAHARWPDATRVPREE